MPWVAAVERLFRDPDVRGDVFYWDTLVGALAGFGFGLWAALSTVIERSESGDLLAVAGAGVGLLAVVLAVLALMVGFLKGSIRRLVDKTPGRVAGFFRPFRIVAVVATLAILFSTAGAIDASSSSQPLGNSVTVSPGPDWVAAVLFGLSIGFFVWAVVGAAQLVRIFVDYGHLTFSKPTPTKDVTNAMRDKLLLIVKANPADADARWQLALLDGDRDAARVAVEDGADPEADIEDVLSRYP